MHAYETVHVQDTGYTIASFYLTFSLLLSGYYIRVQSITLSVAKGLVWASFSRYTFEAMAVNEFRNRYWTEPCDAAQSGAALRLPAPPLTWLQQAARCTVLAWVPWLSAGGVCSQR